MDINDIKHLAVERIYLVPDASEGRLSYAWCDDPAPSEGMDASEAVEYVRKDVADARIAELERKAEVHAVAEEVQIALREKVQEERDELAACLREGQCITSTWYDNESSIGECLNKLDRWSICTMHPDRLGESLARRDKIKQAEALEREADAYDNKCTMRVAMELRDSAQELRRQAEAEQ